MTSRVRVVAGSIIGLLAALIPRAVSAETLAIVGIEPIGTSEINAVLLADALRTKLREAPGLTLVPSKDFMEMKFLFNCMDPATITSCLVPAGKSLNVDKILVGTVTGKRGKHIAVVLKVIDSATSQVVHAVEEEVPAGDLLGVENLARWASALGGLAVPQGQLALSLDPADATVSVDGRAVENKGPLSLDAGDHTLAIAQSGYSTDSRVVTVRAGETIKLAVELRRVTLAAVAKNPSPAIDDRSALVQPSPVEHPGRNAKIVAAVALVAALAGSGIAIYTWRHYSDLGATARGTLDLVRRQDPAYAQQNPNFFFKNPTCNFPAGGPKSSSAATYQDQCNEGTTYAQATTGLVIGSSLLAAVAAVSFGVGMYQANHIDTEKGRKSAFAPRLRVVTPVVTLQGGGISAAFEF